MKTVHVVGYECKNSNGQPTSGGFDWFPKKKDADVYFQSCLELLPEDIKTTSKVVVYKGSIKVKAKTKEKITSEVEYYLEEHGWENAFN